MRITNIATIIALAASGAGCVLDDPELDDYSELDSELGAENRLAANRLAANRLAANRLAANRLAANSLATKDFVSTADGREFMKYVVSCALPSGQSITLQDNAGVSYSFTGWLNLAPAWGTRAPTVSERRWVSACLLARTNVFGVPVNISMRHDSYLPLSATTAEKSAFPTVEGAFYGDLFDANPVWYACGSRAWSQYAANTFRACALSGNGSTTDCNFTYTGNCNTGTACSDKVAPYNSCRGGTTTYSEVITIYLAP